MAKSELTITLLIIITVTAVVTSLDNQSKCCPDFWIQVGHSCYKVSPGAMTWFEAEQYCTHEGGYLIEIRDQKEQSGVLYWIGLTDLADEGTYVWQTDYRETDFTFWLKPKQPDNAREVEHCVHLTGSNFHWNDNDCQQMEHPIHALCERNMLE